MVMGACPYEGTSGCPVRPIDGDFTHTHTHTHGRQAGRQAGNIFSFACVRTSMCRVCLYVCLYVHGMRLSVLVCRVAFSWTDRSLITYFCVGRLSRSSIN
uniref:Uncharacterized protein n=1 Tax=Vitrella brassicaformis TaxID=1169539 RepID=A0A7S1P3H4_9ALVE